MQRFNVKIKDSEEARAQAASYRGSPLTGNQLYRQPEHRQPVIAAARAPRARWERQLPRRRGPEVRWEWPLPLQPPPRRSPKVKWEWSLPLLPVPPVLPR